jgi:hypothetical protein
MRLVPHLAPALLATAVVAAACAGAPARPAPVDADRAPPTLAPLVARASRAVDALQRALSRRMVEELADGPAAVLVCRDEAPALAAEVGAEQGLVLGRTSRRLRNPGNAPRPWVRELLARAAGQPAAEVQAVAVDLGDRLGYLRPILTGQPCLKCHGPAEALSPGIRAALQGAYPADQATGFAEGELRGFFWAEVRKVASGP